MTPSKFKTFACVRTLLESEKGKAQIGKKYFLKKYLHKAKDSDKELP